MGGKGLQVIFYAGKNCEVEGMGEVIGIKSWVNRRGRRQCGRSRGKKGVSSPSKLRKFPERGVEKVLEVSLELKGDMSPLTVSLEWCVSCGKVHSESL